MPGPASVSAAAPIARTIRQGHTVEEGAALLATLIRHVGAGAEHATPADIRKLLLDPVALSAIVRRAGLEAELATARHMSPQQAVLQDVLNRVSPQHLEKLLSVLRVQEQPAVNHDASYGESASLGDPGSSRASAPASAALRELWGHGSAVYVDAADDEAGVEPAAASVDWIESPDELAGWHRSYAEPPSQPMPWSTSAWHPVLIGGTLALALLLPVLLMLSYE